MKKILILIPVVIIIAAIAAVSTLDGIIKKGIESKAPDILGVNVSVDDVKISLLGGSAQINGFLIGNPSGFKSDKAFYLGQVKTSLSLSSLLSDTIVIKEISISNPEINYEVSFKGANINTIMDNIGRTAPPAVAKEGESQSDSQSGSGKKVIINDLNINNAKVQAAIGAASQSITLPNIHLTGIGEKGKAVSFENASKKVLSAVVNELSKQNLNSIIAENIEEKLGDAAKNISEDITEGVKNLGGKLKGMFE